jgi:hypothetical protein
VLGSGVAHVLRDVLVCRRIGADAEGKLGESMIDLDAPILPGQAAAGITLGAPAAEALRGGDGLFTTEEIISACIQAPSGVARYRSAHVDFWATDGIVTRVMVHGHYRGTLRATIGLGAAPAEVAARIGMPYADESDALHTLLIDGAPGVGLAIATPARRATDLHDPLVWHAPIAAIYVFIPEVASELPE